VARGETSEDIGQRYQLTRKVEIAKIDTGMIPRSRQESDRDLIEEVLDRGAQVSDRGVD